MKAYVTLCIQEVPEEMTQDLSEGKPNRISKKMKGEEKMRILITFISGEKLLAKFKTLLI